MSLHMKETKNSCTHTLDMFSIELHLQLKQSHLLKQADPEARSVHYFNQNIVQSNISYLSK